MPFSVEGLGVDVDQRDGGQRPLASRVWPNCSEGCSRLEQAAMSGLVRIHGSYRGLMLVEFHDLPFG